MAYLSEQWKPLRYGAFLIIIPLLIVGCSPKWHLKQAEKHLRKAEQLGASVRVDTVYKTIQVIVPEVRTDTVLERVNFRDTLFLERDKIKIRLKVDTVKKSVYIAVDCPADTIRIQVPVKVTREIKQGFPWGLIVLAWVIGAAMGLFATRKR